MSNQYSISLDQLIKILPSIHSALEELLRESNGSNQRGGTSNSTSKFSCAETLFLRANKPFLEPTQSPGFLNLRSSGFYFRRWIEKKITIDLGKGTVHQTTLCPFDKKTRLNETERKNFEEIGCSFDGRVHSKEMGSLTRQALELLKRGIEQFYQK